MKAGVLESIEHLVVKGVPGPEPNVREIIINPPLGCASVYGLFQLKIRV
jgi:hypothetical protein